MNFFLSFLRRDDVHNQLLLMKKHLFELSSNREEIKRLECQRSLLSKQISLVRELDALGHAMSSHPLNTLSQRYNVYKKKRNDVLLIQNILVEKAVESERMLKVSEFLPSPLHDSLRFPLKMKNVLRP